MLLIAGTQDAATPPASMRLMHERIEGSRYVELDAAHLSNIEQAPAFTAAVREFFAKPTDRRQPKRPAADGMLEYWKGRAAGPDGATAPRAEWRVAKRAERAPGA